MPTTVQIMTSEVFKAYKERDIRALRKLNDRCIESIALTYNKDLYDLAIISYVLAKVISKPRYWEKKSIASYFSAIQANLKEAAEHAKWDENEAMSLALDCVMQSIQKLEATDRRFVTDMYTKARLKVAATLYAQGFSLGNAADITGLPKREIQSYAGQTMMFDRLMPEKTMAQRLKELRKIFK